MVDKSIIDTAIRYIQRIPADLVLKKAYLFGSYATGSEKPDSDIDIAIVIGKMDDFFAVQMRLMRLRRDLDLRIEPHLIWEGDFNIQNPFAYEIEKTGLKLK